MRHTLGSLHRRLELTEDSALMLQVKKLIRLCDGCTRKGLVDGMRSLAPVNVYHLESVFTGGSDTADGWMAVDDALAATAAEPQAMAIQDENFEALVECFLADIRAVGPLPELRDSLERASPGGLAVRALDEAHKRLAQN